MPAVRIDSEPFLHAFCSFAEVAPDTAGPVCRQAQPIIDALADRETGDGVSLWRNAPSQGDESFWTRRNWGEKMADWLAANPAVCAPDVRDILRPVAEPERSLPDASLYLVSAIAQRATFAATTMMAGHPSASAGLQGSGDCRFEPLTALWGSAAGVLYGTLEESIPSGDLAAGPLREFGTAVSMAQPERMVHHGAWVYENAVTALRYRQLEDFPAESEQIVRLELAKIVFLPFRLARTIREHAAY